MSFDKKRHNKVMCKICCTDIDRIYDKERKPLKKSDVLRNLYDMYEECEDIDICIELERAIDRIG